MNRYSKKAISILIVIALMSMVLAGCTQGKAAANDKQATASTAVTAVNLKQEAISKDNIMSTIKELISEKYAGRLAGTKENYLAAQYIADYYKKIGLENPEGLENYMQFYQQPLTELKDAPVLQLLDSKGNVLHDFNYPENFVLRRLSGQTNNININAPLYLIEDMDMLYKESNELKGKFILIPWKYYNLVGGQIQPVDFARISGALGAISEFDLTKNDLGFGYLKVAPLCVGEVGPASHKPFAFVDSDTFSKLAKAAKSGDKLHFACNSEMKIESKTPNVIGLIPGSDPKLKDECIIIGAHFDHVGDNMNGTWNCGALDNASGPAAMMELARVIKASKVPPKKSILFIGFNGESSGFWGSANYCESPVYPLDKSVMINLDMVGSAAKIPLTIAVSDEKSDTTLSDTFSEYAKELGIDFKKGIEFGSDHSSFSSNGVPSVLLENPDMKSGYHTPHDTIEVVDGDRIKEITKLVLYYIEKNAY